jgi:hypothetical protein
VNQLPLRSVLFKAALFWFALAFANFLAIYFFGPQFWSNAGYFFGNNVRITLGVLMFIEGGVLVAFGLVWASGSMETSFEGNNLMTNPYYQKEQWRQRAEQTKKQNEAGKILMFAGGPILIVSFILVIL